MTRVRLAAVLAVVAGLVLAGTAVLAITSYGGGEGSPDPAAPDPVPVATLAVVDPVSGAWFAVPDNDWRVRGQGTRIYYADSAGRPAAVVRGPAIFRPGYCEASPKDSTRAFAGFTRQPFDAWVGALGPVESESAGAVTLADGTAARLRQARVHPKSSGPCAAPAVSVAMVSSGEVRVVLVGDAGAPGTLSDDRIAEILSTLALGDAS